jgi:N-acyl homoserine lactone hydrolase
VTVEVRRVDFGYFVRPPAETGTDRGRAEPVLGYLVDHPDGRVLFDTGMGYDPDVDAHYRPRRVTLDRALAAVGVAPDDIAVVVNCHLHFDHCGGNPELSGRPIVVQGVELDTALGRDDYTLPGLVDRPDLHYQRVDGEAEILPGVTVVATPGHTAGHQSLIVVRPDGTVIVAGQSHDQASAFAADVLCDRARRADPDTAIAPPPAWVERLERLDPRRVVFAHDHAVWVP